MYTLATFAANALHPVNVIIMHSVTNLVRSDSLILNGDLKK